MATKEEVKNDIKKFESINAVSKSDGGKLLVSRLEKDTVSTINELTSKFQTASHIELIALLAKLSERLTLIRVLKRAKVLKKIAQDELDFLINEGE